MKMTDTIIPALFKPITLRSVTFRNRVWMPPMCTYSVKNRDGKPTSWHYQHYVSRAHGGFGLIIAEATAVNPEGRITPNDCGLWNDDQVQAWQWITDAISDAGCVPGIQLSHAGRKASTGNWAIGYDDASVPLSEGGWETVAPSAVPFAAYTMPHELTVAEIRQLVQDFKDAAARAYAAGFKVIEVHAAHGYLISQFLDPLSNLRTDEYGGDLNGRMRFLVEVVDAIREVWPSTLPLLVRISATDWAHGGWNLAQTIEVSKVMKDHGVDLMDVSTGGIVPYVTIPVGPGYQVPFATEVRKQAKIPVTCVGLISKPKEAEALLEAGKADVVEIGRAALREPYWPLHAAWKLGMTRNQIPYPPQYVRGAYKNRVARTSGKK
jgi:2,4-dienoyl-CoA reductase-like NADH-dependent reductase (Old Yellow Enzyme family)